MFYFARLMIKPDMEWYMKGMVYFSGGLHSCLQLSSPFLINFS